MAPVLARSAPLVVGLPFREALTLHLVYSVAMWTVTQDHSTQLQVLMGRGKGGSELQSAHGGGCLRAY